MAEENSRHLVLLGDSIFDNGAYTGAEPDVASEHRLPVLDLRLVCAEPEDYANPIEPSGQGGAKIAPAIAQATGLTSARSRGKEWM